MQRVEVNLDFFGENIWLTLCLITGNQVPLTRPQASEWNTCTYSLLIQRFQRPGAPSKLTPYRDTGRWKINKKFHFKLHEKALNIGCHYKALQSSENSTGWRVYKTSSHRVFFFTTVTNRKAFQQTMEGQVFPTFTAQFFSRNNAGHQRISELNAGAVLVKVKQYPMYFKQNHCEGHVILYS